MNLKFFPSNVSDQIISFLENEFKISCYENREFANLLSKEFFNLLFLSYLSPEKRDKISIENEIIEYWKNISNPLPDKSTIHTLVNNQFFNFFEFDKKDDYYILRFSIKKTFPKNNYNDSLYFDYRGLK